MIFKWGMTASKFVKINHKQLKEVIKYTRLKTKDGTFVTTSISLSLQGTILDILFSWINNKEIVVDKYVVLKAFARSLPDNRFIKFVGYGKVIEYDKGFYQELIKTGKLYRLAHLSALLTYGYRSGFIEDAIFRFSILPSAMRQA